MRLTEHLVSHSTLDAAGAARRVRDGVLVLERLPFVGRPVKGDATLRELVLPAGSSGYVLLYRVGPGKLVSVLAARHQREEHYH